MEYRKDIDGLRGLAVIAVIIFHLQYLKNGYLGVDIFFVISGYLLTTIIYSQIEKGEFSILNFYKHRIRRIIPLLLVVTLITIIIGSALMLPEALKRLSQSVIASNLSVNNILLFIKSKTYWTTQNEYRPLMHTWSLGIEEQFYLIYPFILLVISKVKSSWFVPILSLLTLGSLILFFNSASEGERFFFLQYRFFELSMGGIGALLFFKVQNIDKRAIYILYSALFTICLFLLIPYQINQLLTVILVFCTVIFISLNKYFDNEFIKLLFENKLINFIGKISFSLYLWHHVIFAFARYSFIEEINFSWALGLILLTTICAVLTYYYIENIFRNRQLFSFKKVIVVLSCLFVLSSVPAMYLIFINGVYKDVPSLNTYVDTHPFNDFSFLTSQRSELMLYNDEIKEKNVAFSSDNRLKVLVVGDSFGRDFYNILSESSYKDSIEISYFDSKYFVPNENLVDRLKSAAVVFFSFKPSIKSEDVKKMIKGSKFNLSSKNLYITGIKNFGFSNGIYYRDIENIEDYSRYFVKNKKSIINRNAELRKIWENKYIDLLKPVEDSCKRVRIFTNDGKFITHDLEHLTKPGAQMYAKILESKFKEIF